MPTVHEIVSKLTASVGPIENTVDTLKSGNASDEVKGIAVTFMPTISVIKKAIQQGLNLVVAHEALFYHHRDGYMDRLDGDPVFLGKQKLIEESGLSIFRLHDLMHRHSPDLIVQGLLKELDWEKYLDGRWMKEVLPPLDISPLTIPTMSLGDMVLLLKQKLAIPFVRVVGDLTMSCSRVGILPGYCGGGNLTIPYFRHADLDVVIAGEGPEWETPEYVRDATALGQQKAYIVLGHQVSEEFGMKYLAASMKMTYPELPVEYLTDGQPFQVL